MVEQNQQEIIAKLSMIDQQMQSLHEQLKVLDKRMVDLDKLKLGLEDIRGSEGKEVMSLLGSGIFVKTKLVSEDLIVDIGGKTLVKKNIEETQKMIEDQVKKLGESKKEIESHIELIGKEAEKVMEEFEKKG
ncbi:MAG: prefoldin subunit alpha [Candidatus Pacearchaeota archaeon]